LRRLNRTATIYSANTETGLSRSDLAGGHTWISHTQWSKYDPFTCGRRVIGVLPVRRSRLRPLAIHGNRSTWFARGSHLRMVVEPRPFYCLRITSRKLSNYLLVTPGLLLFGPTDRIPICRTLEIRLPVAVAACKVAFPDKSPWLNCCQQVNALIEDGPYGRNGKWRNRLLAYEAKLGMIEDVITLRSQSRHETLLLNQPPIDAVVEVVWRRLIEHIG
jgi:hypothetical protein